MPETTAEIQPEKSLCAVCGLFCAACTLFMATRKDSGWLEAMAARFDRPMEDLQCDGCRAERRGFYCRECKMSACTREKGIDFCNECGEYPCEDLKTFQAAMPHRMELWENLARIGEVGYEKWFEEKIPHYSCPECGNLNPPYAISCRQCGHEPGSAYVRRHRAAIEEYLKAQG